MVGGLCLGVDIGGTRLRAMVQDASGTRSRVIEVPVPRTAPAIVDAVVLAATELAGGVSIYSIAIGLPGQTSPTVPVWIPNLRFLDGLPLAGMVQAELGAKCVLINDAQGTLVAEAHEGAAMGRSTVVLVTFGTGIGGAIQLEGKPFSGNNGCAGSFGWLPVGDGSVDTDHGQWEKIASGASLERRAEPWGSAANMLEAARAGDAAATAGIEEFGAVIGRGLAGLASILDPELIVFAGGLSQAFDVLSGPIMSAWRECGSPAARTVPLVPALLGPTAGVVGALLTARLAGGRFDADQPRTGKGVLSR